MEERVKRQMEREVSQLADGIARYHHQLSNQPAGDTPVGLELTYRIMNRMIPVIQEQVSLLESGDTLPSQVPLAVQYMVNFKAEALAYITARVVVSAAYNRGKLTRTAMRIANLIEEDYRFEELQEQEPALANSMARKAERWTRVAARRMIMRKAANVAGIARYDWADGAKLKLGIKLVEMVADTGVIEMVHLKTGKMSVKVLDLTEATKSWMKEKNGTLEDTTPINKPMVCPPRDWTTPNDGGYLTERMQGDLVRGVSSAVQDEVYGADMPDVYSALNAVQATRWSVNRRVFEVIETVWQENGDLGDLPNAEDEPLPAKPAFLVEGLSENKMTAEQKSKFNEWKSETRQVHEYNAIARSKRLALVTKLHNAREVQGEEAIWFPHSLDFRGRLYPMSAELSPQSDDISKAMLEFADGKPLGNYGAYWLHVHLANLFGVDKVSFDDRVLWVELNAEKILDSARDPLDGQRFWTDAEEPWCFLAACFEYAGWRDEGDDYVSHLPIAMDGSCSGIQHFSAMLKDERGGAAVNLTKSELPADIYIEVLNVVKAKLAEINEPLAQAWIDKVDRKIVKRPCMTFAYSVTRVGIRDQIAGEIRKRTDGQYIPGYENWESASYLAELVEQSIHEVVDRAAEAMNWLRDISQALSKQDIPTGWTTPLGFPVVQPYRKAKGQLFKLLFQGQRVRLTLRVEGMAVDSRKQTSSVAPNYVHSMDATHLMMVVNRLVDEGITDSFAMIHDSFGVHACDVDEMHYAIRDEFIKLYSNDRLTEMYQESLPKLPGDVWKKVPTPPEAGTLNLEEVHDADFFFA